MVTWLQLIEMARIRARHAGCSYPLHDDHKTRRPPPPPAHRRLLARRRGGRETPLPAPDDGHLRPRGQGATQGADRYRDTGSAPLPAARRVAVQCAGAGLAGRLRRPRLPLHGGHPGPPAPLRSPARGLAAAAAARYFPNQPRTLSHQRSICSVTAPPCCSQDGGSLPARNTSVATSGQNAVARRPVVTSTFACVMPAGSENAPPG